MNLEWVNKNKIIFWAIWVVLLILILLIVFTLQKWAPEQQTRDRGEFVIWTLYDDVWKMNSFVNTFKQKHSKYESKRIEVVSFENYSDYFYSLVWSFLRWDSPDLFVLNNSDWDFFKEKTLWVDPSVITPSYFRNNFELVFQNDLISRVEIDGQVVEYLKWIPVWYEKLWIFYNFRELRWADLSTWGWVNEAIRQLRNRWSIGIWIWNGSSVYRVWDVIKWFLVQDWFTSLDRLSQNDIRNTFSRYFVFWDNNWDNKYNQEFDRMINAWLNNLDLFSRWELHMVVGFPRMIKEIDKKWYNANFLRASSFPQQSLNNWQTLIDYNYFVINKDTRDLDLSLDFLKYISSEEWQNNYLSLFSHYMPSFISLVNDRLNKKIDDSYNITHESFYDSDVELKSFITPLKTNFDEGIKKVLDNPINYQNSFENLRKRLVCLSGQMINWSNLGGSCN